MTLNLTQQQAEALFEVFQNFILPAKPVRAKDKLIIMMLLKVFRKLRAKLEARLPRGYSITLAPEEAMAYFAYFDGYTFPPTMIYEKNFISAQINEINRQLF
ncbi:hypothetical protein [Mucilaginibacter rubeus]|uniref:Uncharacterized protein n=1 Tax=Mucilaginibacter rubeus TaxID=2027860 RepID=A0A5C1I7U4_9SPHI|nr:hypothetical protein [Mucilaginibacter rubeus]QEM13450.1 hypothetical protein DEO27_026720 [Mucilaginibacter rubeus]